MSTNILTIGSPTHQDIEHAGDIIISSEYSGTLHCEGKLTIQKRVSLVERFMPKQPIYQVLLKAF